MKNKYDLFISYSRSDLEEVTELLERLKKEIPGLTYWFDITGIESASEFEDKIISAITNSSFVLFALSDNSMQSDWTKDEITYAKNIGKKVIPVLLKGAYLKEGWFLFKFGRIDCIDSTNKIQFMKLVVDLSNWLNYPTNTKKEQLKPIRSNKKWTIIIPSVLAFGIMGLFIIRFNHRKLDNVIEDQNNYEVLIAKADTSFRYDDIELSKDLHQSAAFYETKHEDTKHSVFYNLGARENSTTAIEQSSYSNKNICPECHGTGKSETSCPECHGTGSITHAEFTERGQLIYHNTPCLVCNGIGKVTNHSCGTCLGTGYIHKTVTDASVKSSIDIQESITIDSFNDSWIAMRTPYEDYHAYRSKKVLTGNTAHADYTMSITIKGYSDFMFYINSDSESTYDYVMVGELNKIPSRMSNYSSTQGKDKSSLNLDSYKPVNFSNLDRNQSYTIYVVYTKDGTTDQGEDCGYVLIPKSK